MTTEEIRTLVGSLDRETKIFLVVVGSAITETPLEVPVSDKMILKARSTVAGWIGKNPEDSEFWSGVLLKMDAMFNMSEKHGFSAP